MKSIFPSFLMSLIVVMSTTNFSYSQNTALNFDGTNDYIETTYSGISGATARTVEAWIKTTVNAVGNQNVIADWGDMALGHRFTFCVLQNNSIRIEIGGGGVVGTTAVNDGIWHHVAAVYDPSATNKYILYVDGVLETSGNITTTINTSAINNLRIGQRVDGVNQFEGDIDEVRVFDYARTATQILNDMNAEYCVIPTGLKAYYRLNDGIANATNTGLNTAIDVAGNNYNGTLNNFSLSGTNSNWVTGPVVTGGINGSSLTINSCSNYTSNNGTVYTSTGTYNETYTNSAGCDSILTINLTIAPLTSSINVTACDSYTSPSGNHIWTSDGYYQDTLTAVGGCDSVINVSLDIANYSSTTFVSNCESYTTPDGNNTWTASGQYPVTYTGVAGCDSIITYDLTILSTSSSSISVTACDSYTSPSGNDTWTTSGTYSDIVPNAMGCDSIITINLTITGLDVSVTQIAATLTANLAGATYQWNNCIGAGGVPTPIPGETSQSFTATQNGDYSVTIEQNGCQDTSACYTVDFTSVKESDIVDASIYPNPSQGNFTIELSEIQNSIRINVIDLQGKTVLSKSLNSINKVIINEELTSGIYFVKLETDDKAATYKVVVL